MPDRQLGAVGLEQPVNSLAKTQNANPGGAEYGALGADLAKIVAAWPSLMPEVRKAVMDIVEYDERARQG